MSSYVFDSLLAARDRTPGAEVWRGTIARTATFNTVNVRLPVVIPAWANSELPVECRWQPRVEPVEVDVSEGSEAAHVVELCHVVYPQKGDSCLVAFDENNEPWIIHYSPGGA
jgi:hypothetical protein